MMKHIGEGNKTAQPMPNLCLMFKYLYMALNIPVGT